MAEIIELLSSGSDEDVNRVSKKFLNKLFIGKCHHNRFSNIKLFLYFNTFNADMKFNGFFSCTFNLE